ncbi:MAG: hypothetical protein CM15mP29_0490 [Alphaproteobacteria bacterium]|nr:MAG: hypothetical protein CM15mP29_0490 [Alphaproteobacteria bacterium]
MNNAITRIYELGIDKIILQTNLLIMTEPCLSIKDMDSRYLQKKPKIVYSVN